jgi:hypothetical protein
MNNTQAARANIPAWGKTKRVLVAENAALKAENEALKKRLRESFRNVRQGPPVRDGEAMLDVWVELAAAREKHPRWPVDVIHQAAVLAEEAGEVVKAALDMTYAGGSVKDVYKEARQVGAMAIRLLVNLAWAGTRGEQRDEP